MTQAERVAVVDKVCMRFLASISDDVPSDIFMHEYCITENPDDTCTFSILIYDRQEPKVKLSTPIFVCGGDPDVDSLYDEVITVRTEFLQMFDSYIDDIVADENDSDEEDDDDEGEEWKKL